MPLLQIFLLTGREHKESGIQRKIGPNALVCFPDRARLQKRKHREMAKLAITSKAIPGGLPAQAAPEGTQDFRTARPFPYAAAWLSESASMPRLQYTAIFRTTSHFPTLRPCFFITVTSGQQKIGEDRLSATCPRPFSSPPIFYRPTTSHFSTVRPFSNHTCINGK